MSDMPGPGAFLRAAPLTGGFAGVGAAAAPVGVVFAIAGSSSRILFDRAAIAVLHDDSDPVVAAAGQVGSQIKMRVGATWLVANIRSLKLEDAAGTCVAAEIDYLGEGDEDKLTGKLYRFRRGVTRYPMPGCEVFPITTADLQQVYAADDRANITIGTVYPTADIPAALYVDAMLGKHFALVGSTGTGKSTSAALILTASANSRRRGIS